MRRLCSGLVLAVVPVVLALVSPTPSDAQGLGTFNWQLSPLCNGLTLTVAGEAPIFRVSGFLDSCGGDAVHPTFGTAVIDGSGTGRMGLSIVLPNANTVSLYLSIDPASGSGSWLDGLGQSGDLLMVGVTPAASTRPD